MSAKGRQKREEGRALGWLQEIGLRLAAGFMARLILSIELSLNRLTSGSERPSGGPLWPPHTVPTSGHRKAHTKAARSWQTAGQTVEMPLASGRLTLARPLAARRQAQLQSRHEPQALPLIGPTRRPCCWRAPTRWSPLLAPRPPSRGGPKCSREDSWRQARRAP